MDEPAIGGRQPLPLRLEAGRDYYWCRCGRSGHQPLCDGSHKGSAFTPLAFRVPAPAERYLCACKRTATPPYCDGTHKSLGPAP